MSPLQIRPHQNLAGDVRKTLPEVPVRAYGKVLRFIYVFHEHPVGDTQSVAYHLGEPLEEGNTQLGVVV